MRHARVCLALGTSLLAAVGALVAGGDFSSAVAPVPPADEASATEAAPATDAPAGDARDEAPPAPDGAAPQDASTLCADGSHWLCDDFDDDGGLGPPTWESDLALGGTATIAAVAGAPSMPNVMVSALTATAGASEAGRLNKHHFGTATAVRCEFDLEVPTVGDAEALLFEVGFDTQSGTSYRLGLRGKGGPADWYVVQQAPTDSGVQVDGQPLTIAPQRFNHVSVRVTTAAGVHPSLKIDGFEALGSSTVTLANLPPSSSQFVSFGMASVASTSSAWAARFDNVVCDVDP